MRLRSLLLRFVIWTLAAIATLVFAIAAYIAYERAAVARSVAIPPATGIEILEAPSINGAQQWVQIRGRDRRNPVLLFIHGGPGMPMMPWAHLFQPEWEFAFTVAQWDQRGAGLTSKVAQASVPPPAGRVIETHIEDAYQVARYVAARTGQPRIGIVAHSWGSIIGLELVRRHPELFYAYVGTGQILDRHAEERAGVEFVARRAREEGNQQALTELASLQPYPESLAASADEQRWSAIIGAERKWVGVYGGVFHDPHTAKRFKWAPLFTPAYDLVDVYRLMRRVPIKGTTIRREMAYTDLTASGLTFRAPVFFFNGRHDYVVAPSVIEMHFPAIEAPHKELLWFDRSAHWPMIEERERFAQLLIERVRPLAFADSR